MVALADSTLLVITVVLMMVTLVISLLPFVPGPLLIWGIGLAFAGLDHFVRITPLAAGTMTLLMIAGSTTDFWTPLVGMKTRGASCSSVAGTLIGGLVGTFVIPIPIISTLAGAMVGAMALELLRFGQFKRAMRSGSLAFESYVLSMAVEFVISIVIIAVFLICVSVTA
jgi:uncharacterized protein